MRIRGANVVKIRKKAATRLKEGQLLEAIAGKGRDTKQWTRLFTTETEAEK